VISNSENDETIIGFTDNSSLHILRQPYYLHRGSETIGEQAVKEANAATTAVEEFQKPENEDD
jgi:hypothetical protein